MAIREPAMTEIRTERLVLKPVEPADLADLHAHWTEPQVRRFLWDGEVVSPDQVEEVIRMSGEMFGELGAGLWSVRESSSGAFLGCAGFWHFHEPPELELIISLSHARWGQGYAHESCSALIDYVFEELSWPCVQGSADHPNEASLRLMWRLGMTPAGIRPGSFGTIDVFRITRTEAPSPGSTSPP